MRAFLQRVLGIGSYQLSMMVCNIHLYSNLWKWKVEEELIYLICQNILGKGKEGGTKKGEEKVLSFHLSAP